MSLIKAEDEDEERMLEEIRQRATPEKMAQLIAKHVRMYEARLMSGHPVVDKEETSRYLGIWQGMVGKTYAELTEVERGEVIDAIASGE